jgi:hypothetical protein
MITSYHRREYFDDERKNLRNKHNDYSFPKMSTFYNYKKQISCKLHLKFIQLPWAIFEISELSK